jgi:hypothetical protein
MDPQLSHNPHDICVLPCCAPALKQGVNLMPVELQSRQHGQGVLESKSVTGSQGSDE